MTNGFRDFSLWTKNRATRRAIIKLLRLHVNTYGAYVSITPYSVYGFIIPVRGIINTRCPIYMYMYY